MLDTSIIFFLMLLEDCRFDRNVVVLIGVIGIGTVLIYHIFIGRIFIDVFCLFIVVRCVLLIETDFWFWILYR